ncbi:MAG: lipopolysaccharide heptosyltransferase I [Campylobacterales bacterium]|nr:lipopolysaccharide heptosyltransferase I [Campylobacterales bacterium]
MNMNVKKVAIVRLSALGDIVNSAVVTQFIKKAYPSVSLEWITEEVFAPLLLCDANIDKVHTINLKKIKKERNFSLLKENVQKLKNLGEFDIIIDMQGLIKSAIVSRLIGKQVHGFDKNSTRESLAALFYKTTSTISYESGVVNRNCFLVSDALNFTISDEMLLAKQAIFQKHHNFEKSTQKKSVAFVIGASWNSKIYPKEHIVKVCDALQEDAFIIWGNETEKAEAEWIAKHTLHAIVAPQMNLEELVSFISSMDLVIGNDTGPTHLAWAQNIPSITLFGPTTTRMIYDTKQNIGIKSPSKVDIYKIDKNDYSIREIAPKIIIHHAKELLNGL